MTPPFPPALPPMQAPQVVGLCIMAGSNIQLAQPLNPDAIVAQIAAGLLPDAHATPDDLRVATSTALALLLHADAALKSGHAARLTPDIHRAWGIAPPSAEDDAIEAERKAARRENRPAHLPDGRVEIGHIDTDRPPADAPEGP